MGSHFLRPTKHPNPLQTSATNHPPSVYPKPKLCLNLSTTGAAPAIALVLVAVHATSKLS